LDLEGDASGNIHSVPGDLAIALGGMHVAHIDAGALHLHRSDQDGAGPDGVDVHVAIGLVLGQLLSGDRVRVRRADEEGAEIAGIVRIRYRVRWGRTELPEEGTHAHHDARHVGWREGQDRMLYRFIGQGGIMVRVAGDLLRRRLRHRHADLARLVENDGVAMDDLERLNGIAAFVAFDGILTDPFEVGFGPHLVTDWTARGDVGVAEAKAFGRGIMARRGSDRGDRDVADADGDAIAGFRPGDIDGLRHFMAAA